MIVFAALVALLAFLAFIAFIGLAGYFWFRRRVWTRDRFAFHAVASCTTVTVAVVGTITGNAPPWSGVRLRRHDLRERLCGRK